MPNQIIPAAVKICGMDFDMALLTLLRFIRITISFRNKKNKREPVNEFSLALRIMPYGLYA
jgi:hypothetical protein